MAKTKRPHRVRDIPLAWYAIMSVAGCAGHLVPLSPPTSQSFLACSLNQFERLGYLVSPGRSGSPWYQAFRGDGGGGQEISIRMVDDGRRAAWLDVRVSKWGQLWQAPRLDDASGPVQAGRTGWLAEDDVRTVVDRCQRRAP